MFYFYLYTGFLALVCLVVTSYVLVAWYGVHKRMWQLCFRVRMLARGGRPGLKRALETHPLRLFFLGRVQLELDREIARLEQHNYTRRYKQRLTIWPAEQLRYMTERVDRLEKMLVS
jgi:hypothetical protein